MTLLVLAHLHDLRMFPCRSIGFQARSEVVESIRALRTTKGRVNLDVGRACDALGLLRTLGNGNAIEAARDRRIVVVPEHTRLIKRTDYRCPGHHVGGAVNPDAKARQTPQ